MATLRLARAFAAKHLPWFAPALYRCQMVLTDAVTVAAIDDHYNVYWNPAAVQLLVNSTQDRNRYLEELAFIWVHEISHVLREHSQRSTDIGATPKRWNCCADMEINDSQWPGTRPPTLLPPVTPATLKLPKGKLAEWYYRQDETKMPEMPLVDCGSGSHGSARPWEVGENRQQLGDTDREIIRRSVAKEMSKQPGSIPGHWKVWVDQTLNPKIDWRQLLQQRLATAIAVGSGARVDYSFRRPGRRQSVYNPVILPTLSGRQRNQLAVVIDTSGSMQGQPLGQAVAEIYGILTSVHQKISLIPCDAQSFEPVELSSPTQLREMLELPGGGGTDMRAGINAALQLTPVPDCILVLTDGFTPYPAEIPKVPTLFGILHDDASGNQVQRLPHPPWGDDQVIVIPTNAVM